jgi:hypothetical protein
MAAAASAEVLYDTLPWIVSRISSGQMCDARILTADRLFQLAAVKEGTVINITGKDWDFPRHQAMVHIVAGEGSGFGMTAVYEGYSVQSGSKTEAIYLLLSMLGEDVETLNVKDDKLQVIASVPATGMAKALAAWKACADGL